MDPFGIGLIVVAVVIFSVIIGGWIAQSQNPPSVTPGTNNPDADCSQRCADLQARHSERCIAEADERNAEARASSLSDQRNGFLAAAAIATGMAIAALFIPFIGGAIAAGFFAAAAALAVLALALEGAVIAAENDRASKAAIARTCRIREAEARQLLIDNCPKEAAGCIALLSPC